MASYLNSILIFFLLNTGQVYARDRFFQLEELSMTEAGMALDTRSPLAPEETGKWKHKTTVNWRLNFGGPVYWDNNAHMESTQNAVSTVGWHFVLGLRLSDQIHLYYDHHSQHPLDRRSPSSDLYKSQASRGFANENSYGVKIIIYETGNGRSIFR